MPAPCEVCTSCGACDVSKNQFKFDVSQFDKVAPELQSLFTGRNLEAASDGPFRIQTDTGFVFGKKTGTEITGSFRSKSNGEVSAVQSIDHSPVAAQDSYVAPFSETTQETTEVVSERSSLIHESEPIVSIQTERDISDVPVKKDSPPAINHDPHAEPKVPKKTLEVVERADLSDTVLQSTAEVHSEQPIEKKIVSPKKEGKDKVPKRDAAVPETIEHESIPPVKRKEHTRSPRVPEQTTHRISQKRDNPTKQQERFVAPKPARPIRHTNASPTHEQPHERHQVISETQVPTTQAVEHVKKKVGNVSSAHESHVEQGATTPSGKVIKVELKPKDEKQEVAQVDTRMVGVPTSSIEMPTKAHRERQKEDEESKSFPEMPVTIHVPAIRVGDMRPEMPSPRKEKPEATVHGITHVIFDGKSEAASEIQLPLPNAVGEERIQPAINDVFDQKKTNGFHENSPLQVSEVAPLVSVVKNVSTSVEAVVRQIQEQTVESSQPTFAYSVSTEGVITLGLRSNELNGVQKVEEAVVVALESNNQPIDLPKQPNEEKIAPFNSPEQLILVFTIIEKAQAFQGKKEDVSKSPEISISVTPELLKKIQMVISALPQKPDNNGIVFLRGEDEALAKVAPSSESPLSAHIHLVANEKQIIMPAKLLRLILRQLLYEGSHQPSSSWAGKKEESRSHRFAKHISDGKARLDAVAPEEINDQPKQHPVVTFSPDDVFIWWLIVIVFLKTYSEKSESQSFEPIVSYNQAV